jgi:FkbM family methyltransferase
MAKDAISQKIELAIEQEMERLRQLKGREGILAEKRRYSLYDEELVIRDFFQDRRDGYFLDVGCAWPIMANNTYYLEKHLGWKGIGIDALSEYGPAWKEKRPGSRFFSYLVSDRSSSGERFYRSPDTGLSSTSKRIATGEHFGAALETEEIQVEAITLDDLLDREGVTKIDLLAMDIEGHEPKALAGFDIDRFRPELAVVEHSPPDDGTDPVYDYFVAHGYELIEKYRPYDPASRYFRRVER